MVPGLLWAHGCRCQMVLLDSTLSKLAELKESWHVQFGDEIVVIISML